MRPLLIQDAKQVPEYAALSASKVGFTRYLGVPVHDADGSPTGTLCIIDGRSDQPLDAHDERFVSLLGMRISAELAREQHLKARLEVKDRELGRRQRDLEETHAVLGAMNQAFEALSDAQSLEDILRQQTALLKGVLGATAGALVLVSPSSAKGYILSPGRKKPSALTLSLVCTPTDEVTLRTSDTEWASMLGSSHAYVATLPEIEGTIPVVALGFPSPVIDEERHAAHFRALADQIYLLLSAFRLQKQLVDSNKRLQDTHVQMVQSEKLSAAGALAATTAHDIRNIVSSLTLLTSDPTSDPEDSLRSVREQLDRFNTLAHRLLAYAKPRLVEQRPVDVLGLLRGVLALTAAQLQVSGVEARIEAPSDVRLVPGDHHQLEHLFVNLTLNAAQAMHPSGGRLCYKINVTKTHLRVRVVDSGSGIAGDPTAVFEPFASTRTDGFGLGLFSCRRIAEEHRGTLTAHNNRGAGATFVLELPLEDA